MSLVTTASRRISPGLWRNNIVFMTWSNEGILSALNNVDLPTLGIREKREGIEDINWIS